MNKHVIEFRNFLQRKELFFEEFSEGKIHHFFFNQNIKNGPLIRIIIELNEDASYISIYLGNYVTVENPAKRDYVLQLLNELNYNYTFSKFTMDHEGKIIICAFSSIVEHFETEEIMLMVLYVLKSAEDEYSRFMKIIWS